MLTKLTDQELIQLLAAGDEMALTAIYHRYWKPLFITAHNVLKDKDACEDIVQDIFLQLWLKRETVEIRSSLQAYLYTATRYQVFSFIRKNKVREAALTGLDARCGIASPDEALAQKELAGLVNAAVKKLPEKCRAVYNMSRDQQLSHREIASEMNISVKTVENQLTIALKKIRQSVVGASVILAHFWTYLS